MSKYKPETKFEIDGRLVFNLHRDHYPGKSVMRNDVAINITAHHLPREQQVEIAMAVCGFLNAKYPVPGSIEVEE